MAGSAPLRGGDRVATVALTRRSFLAIAAIAFGNFWLRPMPQFDVGTGISEGITLGTAGFAAGGPLGGLAGFGIGAISGALQGGRRRQSEKRLRRRNESLLSMLQRNVESLGAQRAGDTAEFSAGRAELESTIEQQASRDSGSAAARGLSGSGFEIGQAANRARALGRGTSSLLATSESRLSQDRRAALARLLQGFSLTGQTDLALLGANDRREASSSQARGDAFAAAAAAGLFGRPQQTTGAGTFGAEPFIDSVPQTQQLPQQLPQGVPVNDPFLIG